MAEDKGAKLVFSDEYFEGEVREGFYIEPMMKHAWAAQLELLHDLQKVFENHSIRYFADWGTLLGAVRHKGFIPWDDDIDIVVERTDWIKFLECGMHELPEYYKVYYADFKNMLEGMCGRITTGGKVCIEKGYLKKFHGCPYSVGIDVFILDTLPDDKEERGIYLIWLKLLHNLLALCENGQEEQVKQNIPGLEDIFNVKIRQEEPLLPQLSKLLDRINRMYENENGKEWTEISGWVGKETLIFQKEWYADTICMPFENILIPVPQGYDSVLRVMYGENYMTPIRGGADHEYPFYKKQEEILKKMLG